MNIILQKGDAYSADFTLPDYPVLTADWTGSVSLYLNYPGTAVLTKSLTLVGDVLRLSLTNSDILGLTNGTLTMVATAANPVLSVSLAVVEYVSVLPVNVSTAVKTKIFGTIEKPDGTPTGAPTTTLVNTTTGTMLQAGWKGVDVKASIAVADADAGKIVGVETVATQTNAAGYFELYVIQGLTVTITCPVLGKSISVATIGLTEVDISTFF